LLQLLVGYARSSLHGIINTSFGTADRRYEENSEVGIAWCADVSHTVVRRWQSIQLHVYREADRLQDSKTATQAWLPPRRFGSLGDNKAATPELVGWADTYGRAGLG